MEVAVKKSILPRQKLAEERATNLVGYGCIETAVVQNSASLSDYKYQSGRRCGAQEESVRGRLVVINKGWCYAYGSE